MATVTIWTEEDVIIIDYVDEAPHKSDGGWAIVSECGERVDWFAEGIVKRIEYDATCDGDETEQEETTVTLKFDIDFSAVDGATQALESLALAAVEAERAVNSLNRTMAGTVGKEAW